MNAAVKILTKAAFQSQSGAEYEDGAMQLFPITSGRIQPNYNTVDNEATNGTAFKDVPRLGNIDITGTLSFQVDTVAFFKLLDVFFGSVDSDKYKYGTNAKKFSFVFSDGVKVYKYANVYPKSLKITSSAGNKVTGDLEVVASSNESRTTDDFPEVDDYGDFFLHSDMSGDGFFRVGDQDNALALADNLHIEEFSLELTSGFDSQFANQRLSLTPIYAMTAIEVSGSFKVSRYGADTFLGWRDNGTKLQLMAKYVYGNENLVIKIPNFIIQAELEDEDVIGQNITLLIGRNGYGTSYLNSNMEFISPIEFSKESV